MINKLKKALDNQESIKSTIIMYGENDFFEEEVFILGDNPLRWIKIFKANRLYWENSRVYPSRNKRRKKYGNR